MIISTLGVGHNRHQMNLSLRERYFVLPNLRINEEYSSGNFQQVFFHRRKIGIKGKKSIAEDFYSS